MGDGMVSAAMQQATQQQKAETLPAVPKHGTMCCVLQSWSVQDSGTRLCLCIETHLAKTAGFFLSLLALR